MLGKAVLSKWAKVLGLILFLAIVCSPVGVPSKYMFIPAGLAILGLFWIFLGDDGKAKK